jgi:hypothetical protein
MLYGPAREVRFFEKFQILYFIADAFLAYLTQLNPSQNNRNSEKFLIIYIEK